MAERAIDDRVMFSRLLREAKERSGQTWPEIAEATGFSITHVKRLAYGQGITTAERAAVLGDYLAAPKLGEVMARIRTRQCERCAAPFMVDKHQNMKRFCSPQCQNRSDYERHRGLQMRTLQGELLDIKEERDKQSASILRFCMACEPPGVCRMAGCELRDSSPLPLAAVRSLVG